MVRPGNSCTVNNQLVWIHVSATYGALPSSHLSAKIQVSCGSFCSGKMAPRLALSKIEFISDMLRSNELTISQIACAAECSKRSIYSIRSNLNLFRNARAPPIRVGRPRILTPAMLEALCDYLLKKPTLYLDELSGILWDDFGLAHCWNKTCECKRFEADFADYCIISLIRPGRSMVMLYRSVDMFGSYREYSRISDMFEATCRVDIGISVVADPCTFWFPSSNDPADLVT